MTEAEPVAAAAAEVLDVLRPLVDRDWTVAAGGLEGRPPAGDWVWRPAAPA